MRGMVRHVGGPSTLSRWREMPSLEKRVNRPVQIVLTDRGARRAKSVEVIKIIHLEGDIVVLLGHPLHQLCYTYEDVIMELT